MKTRKSHRKSPSLRTKFKEPVFFPRNTNCRRYQECLDRAAKLDLEDMGCSRCVLRDDQSGLTEEQHMKLYLELLSTLPETNTPI